MNTERIMILGPSILLLTIAACSGDDSTTKPKSTTSTTGGAGTTTGGAVTVVGAGAGAGAGTTTGGAGGAGSTTSGGSTGSTTAAATTTTGAGGSTGAGGAGGAGGCAVPTAATGLISDFATANVSNQLTGGTDVWFVPAMGMVATVTNGVMHFASTATDGGANDYPGVSTLIASKPGMKGCVDLTSKYTAISFRISSPINTSLLFEITSLEVAAAMPPDGSGFRTSFPVTPTLTTQTIQLSTLVAPSFGIGLTQSMMPGFDIKKDAAAIVIGVGTQGQSLDIMLDDVTFQ